MLALLVLLMLRVETYQLPFFFTQKLSNEAFPPHCTLNQHYREAKAASQAAIISTHSIVRSVSGLLLCYMHHVRWGTYPLLHCRGIHVHLLLVQLAPCYPTKENGDRKNRAHPLMLMPLQLQLQQWDHLRVPGIMSCRSSK
jgi:hypothetical protein